MSQQLGGATTGAADLRASECSIDDHRHGTMRAERAKGRAAPDEHDVRVRLRSATREIRHQRFAELVRQWEARLTAALAEYVNPRAFPIDVAKSNYVNCGRTYIAIGPKFGGTSVTASRIEIVFLIITLISFRTLNVSADHRRGQEHHTTAHRR
jgi:hypothetical protein